MIACLLMMCCAAPQRRYEELFSERAHNAAQVEPYHPITVDVPFDREPPPPESDDCVMSYPVPKTVTEEQAAQQADWANAEQWK